ncbi:hypothetical protein GCM10008171_14450 [Methylopila jiangsuensis]|uniref:Uncharacterized protein n=1 Tax=Methylopila jiangsuensis TaxID=586230 RepID=A0A9W6JGW2_9HYPH|nr:hypothetical protein GCM10008171_14450 [Methylopila jiangsuensis]
MALIRSAAAETAAMRETTNILGQMGAARATSESVQGPRVCLKARAEAGFCEARRACRAGEDGFKPSGEPIPPAKDVRP